MTFIYYYLQNIEIPCYILGCSTMKSSTSSWCHWHTRNNHGVLMMSFIHTILNTGNVCGTECYPSRSVKSFIPTFLSGLSCGSYLSSCVFIYFLEMEYLEAHVEIAVHGSTQRSHRSKSFIPALSPAELWLVHFHQLGVGRKQMALMMKLMWMLQILLPWAAGQLKQH